MKVFATCITLLALSGAAYGIQCFVCNSKMDSACQDEFNYDSPALQEAFTQTCDNVTEAFCRKSKIYLKEVPSGEVRVVRECAYQRREIYDCYQKRSEDYYIDVCQCDEDLCNSSPVLTLSLASALAVTLPFFARFL
ncbi:uncharacterized protein [Procambarus clarkii]|uniref:uncharacterized protein isoform X1 n=1 Tax=Procambarus clarkii TaxID=6728 RepID=UPI001E672767|nr:uncharacterized protein LOC123760060 isoform X2 [Procambarus clarkii]